MLENLLTVAGQVATLFLMMAAGFALVKTGLLDKRGLGQMSVVLLYVSSPCTVLNAFQAEGLPGPAVLGTALLVLAAYYVVMVPVSLLFYRREEPETRSPLRFGVVYGNVGFMGLPLLEAVLGSQSLIYGAISMGLMNTLTWTHGVAVMGGKVSAKKAVLNPGVLPLLAAVAMYFLKIRLPGPVVSALGTLGSMNTPLAMVVIGGQMATADLLSTFTQRKLYGAAAVKLLVAPALAAVTLLPFGLPPLMYCAAVVMAATPTAGNTSIFAQRFEQDTTTAAQLVSLSTLLSIITLPLAAVLGQTLAGGI